MFLDLCISDGFYFHAHKMVYQISGPAVVTHYLSPKASQAVQLVSLFNSNNTPTACRAMPSTPVPHYICKMPVPIRRRVW